MLVYDATSEKNRIHTSQQDVRERLVSKQEAIDLLVTIPGINEHAASVNIAEIGTDMTIFKMITILPRGQALIQQPPEHR